MSDIDSSWKAYNDSDADWNANLMNSIVGLERYYGAKRSAQTEGKIQMLFLQLDDEFAAFRCSDIVKELRAGKEPEATQQTDGVALAYGSAKTTETMRNQLYALARCFPRSRLVFPSEFRCSGARLALGLGALRPRGRRRKAGFSILRGLGGGALLVFRSGWHQGNSPNARSLTTWPSRRRRK